MRLLVFVIVAALCLTITSAPLHANVLTFDDVPGTGGVFLPAGYGGFNWMREWIVVDDGTYFSSYGNTYGCSIAVKRGVQRVWCQYSYNG